MSGTRINLQNSPRPEGVIERTVTFESHGVQLRGVLYAPENASPPLPAVIVTGAWTSVKEQMAGTYARELAARGYASLAFDFRGWGESDGSPRYVEDPVTKTEDIRAAAAFLASLDDIDPARIASLGVCASSGYMAVAVADDEKLNKLALVAPWLHDLEMAETIYGGADVTAGLIASSEALNAEDTVLIAASQKDKSAVMYQAPYYTETDRGLIASYDNKFSALSWKSWLNYDAQASADRLKKPALLVGSPSIALPADAAAYEARTRAPLQKVWLDEDVTQFDFYDRADVVTKSADAVAQFLSG